jgi:cytochrome c oxidase assembly factor CtaG
MDVPGASSLNVDPLLGGALVAVGSLVAWVQHRGSWRWRRGAHLGALSAAVTVLGVAWLSPLATVAGHYLLSAHLLQVTLVMGVAAPLLLLALPRGPRIAAPRPLLAALRVVVHPAVAIVLVNAAFFGWHMTAPYDAGLRTWWLYDLQQLTLLFVSIAFWWPIVTPFSPPVRAMSAVGKMGYILLATIPQTFGGLAVALAHQVLYPVYASAPRVLGLDPMTDQQIAGASIALVSKIALLTAFVIVFMRLLESGPAEADDEDGGGGGGGLKPRIDSPQPVPSGSPPWLADLNAGRTVYEPSPPLPPRIRAPAGSGSDRG